MEQCNSWLQMYGKLADDANSICYLQPQGNPLSVIKQLHYCSSV